MGMGTKRKKKTPKGQKKSAQKKNPWGLLSNPEKGGGKRWLYPMEKKKRVLEWGRGGGGGIPFSFGGREKKRGFASPRRRGGGQKGREGKLANLNERKKREGDGIFETQKRGQCREEGKRGGMVFPNGSLWGEGEKDEPPY